MKFIPLTQGKFAMVDDDAPAWIFEVKWYADRVMHNFYAARNALCIDGKRRKQRLHRVIAKAPPGIEVDHIDGDGLNNRNANLRPCAHVENMRGRLRKRLNKTSEFRGVTWSEQTGNWRAGIRHTGRSIHIGCFDDELEAARAFDAKARELGWPEHGLNFPHDTHPPPRNNTLNANNNSGFIGVWFCKTRRCFEARIYSAGQSFFIGRFVSAEEAALARDEKARELGKPERKMNFPQ